MRTTKKVVKEPLLGLLVEELKLPLLHIARQSELSQITDTPSYKEINEVAQMAIRLIDSYILSIQSRSQAELNLEPVSISSVLQSTAENLVPIAKMYDCKIEIHSKGSFVPVMGKRNLMEAAFTMLGHTFIEANQENDRNNTLYLSSYKTTKGISAGIFSDRLSLNSYSYKRAMANVGTTRQAIPELTQSAGAGVFIADALFSALATRLRVAHYKKLNGLAATMLSSQQLSLV